MKSVNKTNEKRFQLSKINKKIIYFRILRIIQLILFLKIVNYGFSRKSSELFIKRIQISGIYPKFLKT